MSLTLREIGEALGSTIDDPRKVTGFSTDTRTCVAGDVFIALKGSNFDGHEFLEIAKQKGAIAAIVSETQPVDMLQIKVNDTRIALGELAAFARQKFQTPMIAVTGSCGKTTTKTMIASALAKCGKTLATVGTFNNDIGLPKTLLQLNEQHQYAVLEMGANHFGEIEYLTKIAKPNVAVITNIGAAHLEGFGSLEGVVKAKTEIFLGLPESGIAVLNADDDFFPAMKDRAASHPIITFGENVSAMVRAIDCHVNIEGYAEFTLCIQDQKRRIKLPMMGRHNISNALASAAALHAWGLTIDQIAAGIMSMEPVAKRLTPLTGIAGVKIIDDSYNAIPNAVFSALDTLAAFPSPRVFVFGGMAELGKENREIHEAVGRYAFDKGIDHLFAVGENTKYSIAAFGEKGRHFASKEDLIDELKNMASSKMTILIKGSKSTRMTEVVDAMRV